MKCNKKQRKTMKNNAKGKETTMKNKEKRENNNAK